MTTTDKPAKTRWVWIRERDGGRVLAFQYVDPVAGPSAKGARVGEPPSPEDVRRVVDHPDRTFRQPKQFSAMPVRPDEALRLGLPRDPPWIGHFEDKPIPPRRGEPSRVVAGRVVQNGEPVAGARVRLGLLIGPDLIRLDERQSDAAGRFEFPLAPVGKGAVIADVAGASSRLVSCAEVDEVELVLARTGVITGEVHRAGALAPAQVSIYGRDGEPYRLTSTRTPGIYRLDDVVPGGYEIRATALDSERMTNGVPVVEAIEVTEGATVTRDFTLIAGAVVQIIVLLGSARSGRVHLIAGDVSPSFGSELRPLYHTPALRSANSMSSKDGVMKTAFCDVGPGEYTVCAEPWDSAGSGRADQPVVSKRIVVGDADQAVLLTLPPPVAE